MGRNKKSFVIIVWSVCCDNGGCHCRLRRSCAFFTQREDSMIRTLRLSDKEIVKFLIQAAFGGYPWFEKFEKLDDAELKRRWQSAIARPGFAGLVTEEDSEVVAAFWWDTPSLEDFAAERGEEIAGWVQTRDYTRFIWGRDIVVSPSCQKRGLATELKARFLSLLDPGTLVLTRLRDDNYGIIAISQKQGYQRTGVRVPSSQVPGLFHEYWYKII